MKKKKKNFFSSCEIHIKCFKTFISTLYYNDCNFFYYIVFPIEDIIGLSVVITFIHLKNGFSKLI